MKAKENIRLWFEFYKLALNNSRYSKEISESKKYYEAWGDCSRISFDKWWKEKSYLFDEVTIRVVAEVDDDKSCIYLKVPLNSPITDLMQRFRDIVVKFQETSEKQKVGKKSKAIALGSYHLTLGTEFRASRNYHVLLIYRDVFLKIGRPAINEKFLKSVQEFYSGRKATKFKKVPVPLALWENMDDSAIRTARRYIKDAEKLMLAAAKGDFPGKST